MHILALQPTLMSRLARCATEHHDLIVDKFVGDEDFGIFIPALTHEGHAARAVDAGLELFRATGDADPSGPGLPIGIGVHTGVAHIGARLASLSLPPGSAPDAPLSSEDGTRTGRPGPSVCRTATVSVLSVAGWHGDAAMGGGRTRRNCRSPLGSVLCLGRSPGRVSHGKVSCAP